MKRKLDLKNFGLVELNKAELSEINGGSAILDTFLILIIKIITPRIPPKF